MKTEYRICPVCGEVYSDKNVEKILLGHLNVKMSCPNGHVWTEKYILTYTGYEYQNNKYDRDGTRL